MTHARVSLSLLPILLLSTALLTTAALRSSYWEDEAFTATMVQAGWDNVTYATASDVHPPLYFLAASLWGSAFGYEEIGLRSLSILFLILAQVLTYCTAARLFDSKTGLISAALLAFSPLLLIYGHNARYYAMSLALALAAFSLMLLFFGSHRWWALAGYVVAGAALLYTVYTSAAVLLGLALLGLLQWRWNRGSGRQLSAWVLAHILISLAYLPWLPNLLATTESEVAGLGLASLGALAVRAGYLAFVFAIGETINPLSLTAWVGLLAGGAALVSALIRGWRSRSFWTVMILVLIGAGANLAINLVTVYPQSAIQSLPNRSLYLLPFVAIVLAYGIAGRQPRQKWALLGVIAVVYLAGTANYFAGAQFLKPNLAVPWNAVMEQIRIDSGSDAVVLCNGADTTCGYFLERYGFEPRSSSAWNHLSDNPPGELWWLQSNLGRRGMYDQQAENAILAEIEQRYRQLERTDYIEHHPAIRMLKTRFLGQEDYAFRLNVYRFSEP